MRCGLLELGSPISLSEALTITPQVCPVCLPTSSFIDRLRVNNNMTHREILSGGEQRSLIPFQGIDCCDNFGNRFAYLYFQYAIKHETKNNLSKICLLKSIFLIALSAHTRVL